MKSANKKMVMCHVCAVFLSIVLFAFPVSAVEIIVNNAVPSESYSMKDIRAIFAMQKRFWANNKQIKVYTLPDNHPVHKDFVKNILHMLPYHLRIIWDRMVFSGTGGAPIELDSEQEMLKKIGETPDSIGYISSKAGNENIRTLTYD